MTDDMAMIDPVSGATVLSGAPGCYVDGSEAYVAGVVAGAGDRSSTSAELEAGVIDWASSCHLSSARSNLLAPLQVAPGMRVLDLGGGTGPLARHLIDRGARVTLVDSSLERVRIAVERCAGTGGLEAVVGDLDDLDPASIGSFDVVVGVGVFEYLGASPSRDALRSRLARAASLVAPGGSLVVGIENQLGLKYLAGHLEDHESLPWVGVEGYPVPGRAVTPSRSVLAHHLHEVGLVEQRWLFPFPDYKHPHLVIAEDLYRRSDGAEVVEALVRDPSRGSAPEPLLLFDERSAHGAFLRAGLGPDVANSFLVVASRGPTAAPLVDPDSMAWLFSSGRNAAWRRQRRLRRGVGERLEIVDDGAPAQHRVEWLIQKRTALEAFIPGRPLDVLVAEHLARGEIAAVADILGQWRAVLEADGRVERIERPAHPFQIIGNRTVLPGDHLDIDLGNFVADGSAIRRIDLEWSTDGSVDLVLVALRAIANLAGELVAGARAHPFGAAIDRAGLTRALAGLAGLPTEDIAYQRLPDAADALSGLTGVVESRDTALDPRLAVARLPFSTLRRRLVELLAQAGAQDAEVDELRRRDQHRSEQLRNLAERANDLVHVAEERARRVAALEAEFAALEARHAARERELAHELEVGAQARAQLAAAWASERWRVGGIVIGPAYALKLAGRRIRWRRG